MQTMSRTSPSRNDPSTLSTESYARIALERLGGLETDEVRRIAWPILLGCGKSPSSIASRPGRRRRGEKIDDNNDIEEEEDAEECTALRLVKESIEQALVHPPPHTLGNGIDNGVNRRETLDTLSTRTVVDAKHREEFEKTLKQIDLDVARSYSNEEDSPDAERKRRELTTFIKAFFVLEYRELYYYQGFHDVCAVTLEVFGYERAPRALRVQREMSRRLIYRDAHRKEFDCVLSTMAMIHEVVRRVDPDFHHLLVRSGASPYYAVSMLICNYAHDVPTHRVQARIFDATIAFGHPVFSVYLAAALPLRWLVQERVMASERDAASIHEILRTAAVKEFVEEADTLVAEALRLTRLVRPLDLMIWALHAKNAASLPLDSVMVTIANAPTTTTTRPVREGEMGSSLLARLLGSERDLVNVIKLRNRTKLHFLLAFLVLLYTLF